MKQKIRIVDETINEQFNSVCYEVKVLMVSDGEEEVAWSGSITFNQSQVEDGRLEQRLKAFAKSRVDDYRKDFNPESLKDEEFEV